MAEEGKIVAGPRPHRSNFSRNRTAHSSQEPANKPWLFRTSLIFLLVCTLVWGWLKLSNPDTLPIRSIKITGNLDYADPKNLRETILPFAQKGFLLVSISGLQDQLQQLPWVYAANVKRVWPDTLVISLQKQQPIARFNDGLLNVHGDVFHVDPNTIPTNLPLFLAPQDQQKLTMQSFQQMSTIVAILGRKISVLALDARQSWRLQLDNGVVLLLGKNDPMARLQRFVAAYGQVVGNKAAAISYVDLRYTHGMAVQYKS